MSIVSRVRNRYYGVRLEHFLHRIRADNRKFDAKHGLATAANIELSDYDLPQETLAAMEPAECTHEGVFRTIINALVPRPQDYDFLDIGCGQGKALVMASTYGFRRVRGIELEPRVCALAQRNVQTFLRTSLPKTTDVEAICADARTFADYRERTFVFVFNPFNGEIMTDFVDQLGRAAAAGREMIVAYSNPRDPQDFERAGFLTRRLKAERLQVFATSRIGIPADSLPALKRNFDSFRL